MPHPFHWDIDVLKNSILYLFIEYKIDLTSYFIIYTYNKNFIVYKYVKFAFHPFDSSCLKEMTQSSVIKTCTTWRVVDVKP